MIEGAIAVLVVVAVAAISVWRARRPWYTLPEGGKPKLPQLPVTPINAAPTSGPIACSGVVSAIPKERAPTTLAGMPAVWVEGIVEAGKGRGRDDCPPLASPRLRGRGALPVGRRLGGAGEGAALPRGAPAGHCCEPGASSRRRDGRACSRASRPVQQGRRRTDAALLRRDLDRPERHRDGAGRGPAE